MKIPNPTTGWAFYDAKCGICSSSAMRYRKFFQRQGFEIEAFQSPGVREKLGLSPDAPFTQMWLLTPEGKAIGGGDALIYLSRKIWWGYPFYLFSLLPGGRRLICAIYRWGAARRHGLHFGPKERQ